MCLLIFQKYYVRDITYLRFVHINTITNLVCVFDFYSYRVNVNNCFHRSKNSCRVVYII